MSVGNFNSAFVDNGSVLSSAGMANGRRAGESETLVKVNAKAHS